MRIMLLKNAVIKVRKSFGRFLSLLIIVAVGVGFFSGIRASAPDITASMEDYYREMNLFDLQVISTLGLTQEDVSAIEALTLAETVVPGYSVDVFIRWPGNSRTQFSRERRPSAIAGKGECLRQQGSALPMQKSIILVIVFL